MLRAPRLIATLLAACAAAPALAQEIPGYPNSFMAFDPREVALLPNYCKYTHYFKDKVPGGSDAAQRERWFGVFGPLYDGMQHYCFALMKTNRAMLLARDTRTKRFYLEDSIAEFDFVITKASDDFILLPEMLTKKAENLIRLDRGPVAVFELERAIAVKPDYWPPYAVLSDHALEQGDRQAARQWLERGLAAAPNTPALQRRLKELDAAKPAASRAKPAKGSVTDSPG